MIEVTEWVESANLKTSEGLFYTVVGNSTVGLKETTDLVSGRYEGGLKLWECSLDLTKYLQNLSRIPARVLELGCGHGLPGILCAQKGSSVCLQDYNEEVIRHVTGNNVIRNGVKDRCRLFYGPWGDISNIGSFDLVLTSETIYNPEYYPSLLTAIRTSQAQCCLVACKNYYFGVGGGLELFAKAAEDFGFATQTLLRIDDIASTRYILELTPKF